jgi:CheY-like chemotaxis protein
MSVSSKVLIVEDDPVLCELIQKVLRHAPGARLTKVPTPRAKFN